MSYPVSCQFCCPVVSCIRIAEECDMLLLDVYVTKSNDSYFALLKSCKFSDLKQTFILLLEIFLLIPFFSC